MIAIACLAAASALPATFAGAEEIELPARKPGMWHIKMALGPGLPERTAKLCLDETTDKAMMAAGLSLTKGMCEKQDVSHEGKAIIIDSACTFGPMKTTSHVVVEGDFQSEYRVHITGAVEGGPKGMPGTTEMNQTVTWISSDCSDGLQPGQMMMPGGIKIDATKLMQSIGGGG
jgi:hypothetical protein